MAAGGSLLESVPVISFSTGTCSSPGTNSVLDHVTVLEHAPVLEHFSVLDHVTVLEYVPGQYWNIFQDGNMRQD